VEARKGVAEW